jgi:hypothetical protein
MLRFGQNTIRPFFYASPGTANPKMNESFLHTAHMSSNRACAQDGYFKCPHPTIIDDDKRSDSGWFCVGFGVGGRLVAHD